MRAAVLQEFNQPLVIEDLSSPDLGPRDVRVQVDAVRPDGSHVAVAAFLTRPGWDQRYWLARPVDLPKGTRLEVKTGGGRVEPIHIWLDTVTASS